MRIRLHVRTAVSVVVVAAGTVGLFAGPAAASPTRPERAAAAPAASGYLANTIALSNCSASLVRFPSSVDTDRALMLTNGHCYEGGMLGRRTGHA